MEGGWLGIYKSRDLCQWPLSWGWGEITEKQALIGNLLHLQVANILMIVIAIPNLAYYWNVSNEEREPLSPPSN